MLCNHGLQAEGIVDKAKRAVGWTSDQAEVGKEYAADAANTASKQVRLLYKLSSLCKISSILHLAVQPCHRACQHPQPKPFRFRYMR